MEIAFANDKERLLRAIWPFHIKADGTLRSSAFKPRGDEGVSTDRTLDRSLEDAIQFLRLHASKDCPVAHVTIRQCKEIGVTVKHTPSKNNPFHSEIYSSTPRAPLDSIEFKKLANLASIYTMSEKSPEEP